MLVQLTHVLQLMMLRTNIPDHIRRPLSGEVVSVIHAPPSFQNWVGSVVIRLIFEGDIDTHILPEVGRHSLEIEPL